MYRRTVTRKGGNGTFRSEDACVEGPFTIVINSLVSLQSVSVTVSLSRWQMRKVYRVACGDNKWGGAFYFFSRGFLPTFFVDSRKQRRAAWIQIFSYMKRITICLIFPTILHGCMSKSGRKWTITCNAGVPWRQLMEEKKAMNER